MWINVHGLKIHRLEIILLQLSGRHRKRTNIVKRMEDQLGISFSQMTNTLVFPYHYYISDNFAVCGLFPKMSNNEVRIIRRMQFMEQVERTLFECRFINDVVMEAQVVVHLIMKHKITTFSPTRIIRTNVTCF